MINIKSISLKEETIKKKEKEEKFVEVLK